MWYERRLRPNTSAKAQTCLKVADVVHLAKEGFMGRDFSFQPTGKNMHSVSKDCTGVVMYSVLALRALSAEPFSASAEVYSWYQAHSSH